MKAGDLPAKTDPAALAGFISAVIHGMAVQAAGGAKRKDLKRVAELALAGLAELDCSAFRCGPFANTARYDLPEFGDRIRCVHAVRPSRLNRGRVSSSDITACKSTAGHSKGPAHSVQTPR